MEAAGQVMVKGVFLTGKAEEAAPGSGGTKEASRLLKASLNLDPSFHLVLWGVEQAYNVGPFLEAKGCPVVPDRGTPGEMSSPVHPGHLSGEVVTTGQEQQHLSH